MKLVLLVLAFALVLAATATAFVEEETRPVRPCFAPPVWEAKIIESNVQRKYFMSGYFSYDSIHKRERVIDEVYKDDSHEYYDIIYLHGENIEYVFNLHTRKCVVRNITRPYKPFGIPKDARYYGVTFIGSPEIPRAGLKTQVWGGEVIDQANNTFQYMGVWTDRACIPVSAVFISEKYGTTSLNFMDVTLGIHDPNVFKPHKECLQQEKIGDNGSNESSSEEQWLSLEN